MVSKPRRSVRGYRCHAGAVTVRRQDVLSGTPHVKEFGFLNLVHSHLHHFGEALRNLRFFPPFQSPTQWCPIVVVPCVWICAVAEENTRNPPFDTACSGDGYYLPCNLLPRRSRGAPEQPLPIRHHINEQWYWIHWVDGFWVVSKANQIKRPGAVGLGTKAFARPKASRTCERVLGYRTHRRAFGRSIGRGRTNH